jgi:hypothetical protein
MVSAPLTFGVHQSDPRLITLGVTGVTASALMLARIRRTSRNELLSRPTQKLIRTGLPGSGGAGLSDQR